jgi:hypothetical protein
VWVLHCAQACGASSEGEGNEENLIYFENNYMFASKMQLLNVRNIIGEHW